MQARILLYTFIMLFLLTSLCLPAASFGVPTEVKIGVLAYRGKEAATAMWANTASYLTKKIPGRLFQVVPLDFHEIGPAVGRGEVDFVISNPEIYVELEATYGVTRIATLKNRTEKGAFTVFGGVIFTRADRTDIRDLKDLKARRFRAVDETSLGGWTAAWRELKADGIDPAADFKELLFLGTHDAVVYAVRDGKCDAGTVRTDTLERMHDEGKINKKDFHVLNPKKAENFPFDLSTRLYPEWPFAKARHASEKLSQQVLIALMNMQGDEPAARAARIEGWTIPLDYQPVHELMKELNLGPYEDYGKVSLFSAARQHWYWVVIGLLMLVLMSLVTFYVVRLNRVLSERTSELEEAKKNLENRVRERTAELAASNSVLQAEIAERRRAERERERLVADLARSNRELEQFAYVASHDLQEPLRMVSSYVELLDRKYHGRLDEKADSYIHFAVDGAERMHRLINGLLEYSRVMRRGAEFKKVDMNRIFLNVVSNLSASITETKAVVTKDDLPVVSGDEMQLMQLLQNLIGNGIKYRRKDVPPAVHVSVKRIGPDWVFSVRDSGIGIDPQYFEKVFQIFQRLHSRGEYPGTGIGLAICKRIVDRHRGRIWIESAPAKGATFFFTLPMKGDENGKVFGQPGTDAEEPQARH